MSNLKKKIDLNGKEWLQNSISIWSDLKKTKYEKTLKHPASFPVALPKRLISIFSNPDDLIFDPFAGVGSTLIAAKELERKSIGIELSKKYIDDYYNREDLNTLFNNNEYEPKLYCDNAMNLDNYLNNQNIRLTVTSPPYWDILNRKRTADYKETKRYSNSFEDLGNIEDYKKFIESLKKVFVKIFKFTKKNGFCCVDVMDIRKKDKLYLLHVDIIEMMEGVGFKFDDLIIWDRRNDYNNFRPLGYPYVFRINRAHEYILIFQKI